jgi:hypothetical protein
LLPRIATGDSKDKYRQLASSTLRFYSGFNSSVIVAALLLATHTSPPLRVH